MIKQFHLTKENFTEVINALKSNEVTHILVNVEKWLRELPPEQKQNQLQQFTEACTNNSSLIKLKLTDFDFKPVEKVPPVEPALMARALGDVANSCQHLIMMNLRDCNVNGSDSLLKHEIFDRYTASRGRLNIICHDLTYSATQIRGKPDTFASEPNSLAFSKIFQDRHKGFAKELPAEDKTVDIPSSDRFNVK